MNYAVLLANSCG